MPELETLSHRGRKPRSEKTLPDLTKPAPGIGDNSKFAPHDRIQMFSGQIRSLETQKAEIGKQIKRLRQRATNSGITLGALSRGEMLAKMDPANAQAWLEETLHYAQAFDVPINTQLRLFDMGDGEESVEAKLSRERQLAFNHGKRLAFFEMPPDSQKYHENSDLGQAHLQGHAEGEKQLTAFSMEQLELDDQETEKAKKAAEDKAARKAKKDAEEAAKKKTATRKARGGRKTAEEKKEDFEATEGAVAALAGKPN